MIVISDNSVLSCLAEIGELDMLRVLYGKVSITETSGSFDRCGSGGFDRF